ncbi:MAG: hypothetical protein SVM79_00880 [Chloroflexota bacterium]|nr:hypothetical protein [Chloroflexota bacterium]
MNSDYNDQIEYAVKHTELVQLPGQKLDTFGVTSVHYYLLTEPMDSTNETRIREGKVIAERPKIVTPDYLLNAFEGFGDHAREQAEALLNRYEFDADIMEYKYRNEIGNSWVLSERISDVITKIAAKIDDETDSLAAILKGPDDAWQISLMKFIMDMTRASLHKNISDLHSRGMFERKFGIPKFVRDEIDILIQEVETGHTPVDELGSKLQSYGIFEQYQDIFFALLHRKG